MADVINNKTAIIKTALNEYTKSYQVLDGQLRLEYLYEAGTHAKHGDACMVTRYSYYGSSSNVEYVKEYESTWDIAFEKF